MNLIRNTLLAVILIQSLMVIYLKFFHHPSPVKAIHKHSLELDTLVQNSIDEILAGRDKKFFNLSLATNHPHTSLNEQIISLLSLFNKQRITLQKPSLHQKQEKSIKEKIERYAKKFLGHKYVWGATGPHTFDCSGFTQKVYHSCAGIHIPRVSRDQAKVGELIPFEELERGDMVFFDTEKRFSKKVNHVGIYLENGDFIHASSGGKRVMITNFKQKPFYKHRFLWGRRVIKTTFTEVSDS